MRHIAKTFKPKCHKNFVELGGGVGGVLCWCRDGAYVSLASDDVEV